MMSANQPRPLQQQLHLWRRRPRTVLRVPSTQLAALPSQLGPSAPVHEIQPLDSRLVLDLHDELLFEVQEDRAHAFVVGPSLSDSSLIVCVDIDRSFSLTGYY